MDSESYWIKRAEEREQEWNKKSKGTIEKELAEYYGQALSRIIDDIAVLYGRYAKDNNLTYAEANKLLTSKEFKQWRMSLEEYLDAIDRTGDNKLLLELNTLAMRKRISRLDKLYSDTLKNLHKLGMNSENCMTEFLSGAYKDNYYKNLFDIGKTIGIKSSVSEVDDKKIRKVLNASWSGKNYSQRIWKNTEQLSKLIKNEITNGFHRGVSVNKMAKLVQQRMNVGKHEATRLVRTEMNYVQNQAALDSIKDAEMKYYIFLATLDKKTSTVCRAHDRKVYPVDGATPGTNMPPLHPHCRSAIAGNLTDYDTGRGKRSARDKDGKRIIIPATMKYDDYYKIYIEESMSLSEWEKANRKPNAKKNDIIKTKEKLYNATTKLKATMQDNDYQEYIDVVAKNKGISYLYINYADKVKAVTYVANNGAYSPRNNTLKYSFEKTPGMDRFSILAHEYGHFFDGNVPFKNLRFQEIEKFNEIIKTVLPNYTYLANRASYSDEFLNALRLDKQHIKNVFNLEVRNRLKSNHASAGVQDAIDGLFVNSRIAWGHGEAYYNRKYNDIKKLKLHNKLKEVYTSLGFTANNQSQVKVLCRIYDAASEAWANIMSAVTTGGKELEYIKEFLPNSYNKFLEIIQEVNKDDG